MGLQGVGEASRVSSEHFTRSRAKEIIDFSWSYYLEAWKTTQSMEKRDMYAKRLFIKCKPHA